MFRSICFFSEVNTGIELLFFLQKNMMQGFFHFFYWVKTKRKTQEKTQLKSTNLKISILTSFRALKLYKLTLKLAKKE